MFLVPKLTAPNTITRNTTSEMRKKLVPDAIESSSVLLSPNEGGRDDALV
jgi:hypothetical protein